MKLLILSSSNPKFKTLDFKPGLNIVSGVQLSTEEKKTINGLGKSLSLKMVHFMFGGSFSKNEAKLETFLKTYGNFTLTFTHREMTYKIDKNFTENHFHLNNRKISKTNYPKELKKIFLAEDAPITFGSFFRVFARRFGGAEYTNVITQQSRPLEDYHQKLANLFLLGVDVSLVKEKFNVKELITKSNSALKAVKEYEKQTDTNTKDLADEIQRLSKNIEEFIIEEDFSELKRKADSITENLNNSRDDLYELRKKLSLKVKNLESSEHESIDVDEIVAVYNESKFFLEDKVVKRLADAQKFHNDLISSRKSKLKFEIASLESSIENLSFDIEKNGELRDCLLKDLSSKGALEEYNSLTERLKTLEIQKSEAEKYQKVLSDIKKNRIDLDVVNAKVQKRALDYLENNKEYLDGVENTFRILVKEFYDNSGGALKIVETQDAKYLFDIESYIPKEGSQGVGEVKIFCYDALLFLLNKKRIGFLSHDGCIFSEMDRRQKTKIFKIVLKLIEDDDLQYFVNITEDSLNQILDKDNKINILEKKQKDYIEKSQILTLYDKDPSAWLFGESFS